MKKFSILSLLFLILMPLNSHALEFGVLGGLNYDNSLGTGSSITYTTKASGAVVAGGFVKKSFNLLLDVELDIIYMKKKSTESYTGTVNSMDVSGSDVYESSSYLIPIIFRTSFVPGGIFNIGAGAYYEVGTSDGVKENGVKKTYADVGVKHSDIGLVGSAQLRLPIVPLFHILVDGRYCYGLTEQSTTAGYSVKNKYIQVLAGFSFGI